MFQVLLVDDEALARNDVKGILDWEKHGFTVCGEASSGEAALSMMAERIPPHIVIMDVSMPAMNGVELSRRIKDQFPKVKMIMLSSYDDYDYVRACLKNGAMDYVLKHRLKPDVLMELLKKAVQDLQSEEREHEARQAQTRMIEQLSPVILREHLSNVTRGNETAGLELQSFARNNNLYPDAVTYGAAAVQIVPFLLLTESLTDVQKNRFVQQATEVMQMAIGDIHKRTVGYAGEGRYVVLFSSEERSENAVISQINQALMGLSHALEKFLNLKCVYADGTLCGSLRQLGESYSTASRKLNDRHGQVTDIQRNSLFIEEQKQLLLFLKQQDAERVRLVISTMFASVQTEPVYSTKVQIIASELLHVIEMSAKQYNKPIPPRSELARMGSVAELQRRMEEISSDIIDSAREQHVGAYSRHVSKAVQFISDNYAIDISLEMTASSLNLNSSYLSRLFKEETKMTFSEYLNRVRIHSSCTLMESGHPYSLKHICSQVGFSNYNYFFKVFKDVKGMTPHAYMEQLKQSKI